MKEQSIKPPQGVTIKPKVGRIDDEENKKGCKLIDIIFMIFLCLFIVDICLRITTYDDVLKSNKSLEKALHKNTLTREKHIKELRRVEDKQDILIKNYLKENQ